VIWDAGIGRFNNIDSIDSAGKDEGEMNFFVLSYFV
jgi:hypothetical protein